MQSDTIFFFFLHIPSKSALYLLRGVNQVNGVSPKTDQKGRGQDLAVFYEIQVWYMYLQHSVTWSLDSISWHISPGYNGHGTQLFKCSTEIIVDFHE